jgi:predicted dehydrogenase
MLRHVTGDEITSARSVRQCPEGFDTEDYGVLTLQTGGGTTATVEIGWTFPVAPVKRYVKYTAVGSGGHIAVDTRGGVEINAPRRGHRAGNGGRRQRRPLAGGSSRQATGWACGIGLRAAEPR